MEAKFKKSIVKLLYILLPLTACIALGGSLYLLHRVLKPDLPNVLHETPLRASAQAFTLMLKGNLLEVLSDYEIDSDDIKIRKADKTYGNLNNIYTIGISESNSLTLLNYEISAMAGQMGGKVFQGIEDSKGRTLTLKVGAGKTPTDLIIIRKIRGIKVATAKMAIIVDDLGIKTLDLARRLCNLEQVVTLSILPFQHRTAGVIELARETGTPYMLHMPMEPKSARANPGEGAIRVSDIESDIIDKLERAFKNVNGADGVNNHMGSKATEDLRTMEIVMKYLKDNNYFFVDSQTSRNSKGYYLSQKKGVKSAKLYSFLDVEDDRDFIIKRLEKLAEAAIENGFVLTICHNRPTTVEVLEEKLPELEEMGIKFVKISDIVH